ncbi:SNF2 family N-terminal domain-containing protein [Delphinella strobiligena]|nr:SNF2 family N-terminal domain-containing protein [Delphinella strobiligena]
MFKPFKPPALLKRSEPTKDDGSKRSTQPPLKRRKASPVEKDEVVAASPIKTRPYRRPLLNVKNPAVITIPDSSPTAQSLSDVIDGQYTVLWRKKTNKMHKTWDGDGYLTMSAGYAILKDSDGSNLGRTACKVPLLPGSILTIAGKDVEIDSVMSKVESDARMPKPAYHPPPPSQSITAPKSLPVRPEKSQSGSQNIHSRSGPEVSKKANTIFRNPMLHPSMLGRVKSADKSVPVPRHDPHVEGALVMKRRTSVPKDKHIVDVVVDPILNKNLREHQRAGVAFMYECVMGMRPYEGEGAILADEMGLGKTLQTIALLWTLLKQNPVYEDGPVIKKALIVCPATLINNWKKEFRKWLGKERIGVLVVEDNKTRLTDFTMGKSYNVMIIGYEKLRNVQAELQKGAGIDIVIADEGHRLKTAQNKSAMAIRSLNTERRIILSGTPIQNDLSEFYTMVDFVNPGLLNKYSTFKRDFESPILKSRQPGASAKDIEKGRERSEELAELTTHFILRRTADILSKYLPPKTEYVLYCRPTSVQIACYEAIVSTGVFDTALKNSATSFQLINVLKKVCNGPKLLLEKKDMDAEASPIMSAITSSVPLKQLKSASGSSKLHVLDTLLHTLRSTTQEKVVIVSNYTTTLDFLGNLMTALDYPFSRLDGSTPVAQRQDLVDRFNRSPSSSSFVFLLSAKAGGMGINLIGASRLVLYDIDWNPATDLQAMARIHRDGQTRPCYIYRLLTKGALEEKIYQRQLSKQDLSDQIVDKKTTASSFTAEELRDLFTLDQRSGCQTHDSLSCSCGGKKVTCESVSSSAAPSPPATCADGNADMAEVTSDDDEELPELPTFMKFSQIDMEAEEHKREERQKPERAKFEKGKGKLQSLMRYAHIDATLLRCVEGKAAEKKIEDDQGETPSEDTIDHDHEVGDEFTLNTAVEDSILRAVIEEEGSKVDFLFSKRTS